MLRYRVIKDGVTTEGACSIREFYGPNSTVNKPDTQIIGIFDPDGSDCEFKDKYDYFYGEEQDEFLDIKYKEIMVPNNKGGHDKVIEICNWQQILLNNPSTSIPSSSNITKGPQLSPDDRVQQVCPGPLSSKPQKDPKENPSSNSAKRKFLNPISKKPTADQTYLKIINRILDNNKFKTKIKNKKTKTNESMKVLNFAVDSESAHEKIMVPNTSMSDCIQRTNKLHNELQQPSTSKQWMDQQPTTSKQSVVPQQPTSSKQYLVPQQPTPSKQSLVPQQHTTSKQSVVPQQPTSSKQAVVPQQPTPSKQYLVPQQHTTSIQSVVPQQPTSSKQYLVPQQHTTSIQSVVPQQPTSSKQSVVLQQPTSSKQAVVPQQPTSSKQSLVPQQPTPSKQYLVPQQHTTSIQSVVPQQPTSSKRAVVPQQPMSSKQYLVPQQPTPSKQYLVPQQHTTSIQSVVPQQVTSSKQSVVLQQQTTSKQSVVRQQPSTSTQSVVLVLPHLLTKQNVVPQQPTTSKIATYPNQSKDDEIDKDNMLIDDPNVCLISSDDENSDNVEPHTNSDVDNYEELKVKSQRKEKCKQFAEFKSVDYESYPLTDENLDGRVVTPVKICDYRMLNIDEFVNDTIVEFYLNYWYCRKLSVDDRMCTYIFNTYFYTSLSRRKEYDVKTNSRHDRVKRWTKKVNIFEKDFIFIPINENYHWFMAVICYPHLIGPVHYEDGTQLNTLYEDDFGDYKRPSPKPCKPYAERDEADGNTEDFRYYPNFSHDGKSTGNYKTDVENLKKKNRIPNKQPVILILDSLNGHTARARIVATLREWISEEYRTKHNGAERDFSPRSMKGTVVKVPQQPNYTDCGLFVMHYFQKFFECPIIDYSCPILHLENWFSIDYVSKNCLKRREVQSIILKVMNEQGRSLPSGIMLPELRFSKPEQQNNVLIQSRQFKNNVQHYQQIQNQQYYHNDQGGDVNTELDNVDEEMYDEFEDSENGQYPVDHHGEYANHGNEYHQEDMETSQDNEGHDIIEIVIPWNDSQEEGDYQSD